MITASGLAMRFAGRELFRDAAFSIEKGDRLALVGANGAGKSTLVSILLGQLQPDEGTIAVKKGTTIGWLPQESAPAGDETPLDLACSINEPMSAALRAMRENAPDTQAHLDAAADFSTLDGHRARAAARRILAGLAFRPADFERPLRTFSGGWVMRAHLARLLVMEPDCLILDEPTNHLDLETLGWFQQTLHSFPGALLVISHDRAFLDDLARGILELRNARLHRYTGNYSKYLLEKAHREAVHLAAYKNQQKEIESLQRFADRFRAKASKASQAQSKLRQIDRMEKIDAPESEGRTISIRFPQPPRSGVHPVRLAGVHFSYGDLAVYRGIDFECERGDRIALVGPNGAGKSTLLKLLGGVLAPQSGERILGHNAKVGYFAQNRVEMLNPSRTVYEEARAVENPAPELLTRTILGSFLFSGDAVEKRVEVLSGGEKSRLALARFLVDPPNVLLLDEPTTHLDMASIEALAEAIEQYEGTLVFISHDVWFIRHLAKKVLRVSAGELTWFAGGYDYYLDKIGASSERQALVAGALLSDARPASPEEGGPPSADRKPVFKTKEQKRAEAVARQEAAAKRRAMEKTISDFEEDILRLEARQKEIVAALESPATYEDKGAAYSLNRELLEIDEELRAVSEEWERAVAELSALNTSSAQPG